MCQTTPKKGKVSQISITKRNILANFAGNAWLSLLSLIFIPLYIHFLGIEAYGLIGIYGIIQSAFSFIDMGMTPTLNKEIARLKAVGDKKEEIGDLLKTMEIIYWILAIIFGVLIIFIAPIIATKWLRVQQLTENTVTTAIAIMGICFMLRGPMSLYSSGLMGMQEQVLCNSINAITYTIGGISCILVLWLYSPTIIVFFFMQVFVNFLQTISFGWTLWAKVNKKRRDAKFNIDIIKPIWKFAAGSGGSAVFGVILTQIDRIILSKILPLESFGFYNLASTIALKLKSIYGPITVALYPHFTSLLSKGKIEKLKDDYHRGCQLIALVILPVTAVILFYSKDIIFLWTQNKGIAETIYVIAIILFLGKALNGLMQLPYVMQLSHGWTSLGFYANLFSIVTIIPLTIYLAISYGMIGAASAWLILNIGYILINMQIMHKKILQEEKLKWYFHDVAIPFIAAVLTAGLCRIFFGTSTQQIILIINIIMASILTLIVTGLALPMGRRALIDIVYQR